MPRLPLPTGWGEALVPVPALAATARPPERWFNDCMPIYAVTYAYDDRTDLMDQVRPQHRAFLAGLYAAGTLLASGPVSSGTSRGALILVRAESAEGALGLLDADPLAEAGLLADRAAVEWTCVYGPWSD